MTEQMSITRSIAQRKVQEAKRRAAAERAIHPKERDEIRARARQNVSDDLQLLIKMAATRKESQTARIALLGKTEWEYLKQLSERLERLP